MINIVIIGYPGSGKSTHGRRLAREFGLVYLESGGIFRRLARKETEMGKKINSYLTRGALIPDRLVFKVILEKIDACLDCNGMVFDGFPRNLKQAKFLDQAMRKRNTTIHFTYYLKLDKEIAKQRITERTRNQTDTRKDLPETLVEKRIRQEGRHIHPLIRYYKRTDRLYKLFGCCSIDAVQWAMKVFIEREKKLKAF